MCEQTGIEPTEIVEQQELPDFVAKAITIFSYLSDNIHGFSGSYLGKDYSIVFNLFEHFDVTYPQITFTIIKMLEHKRVATEAKKADKQRTSSKKITVANAGYTKRAKSNAKPNNN